MAITKIRGGQHNQGLRECELGEHGLVVGETISDNRGIITGVAQQRPA